MHPKKQQPIKIIKLLPAPIASCTTGNPKETTILLTQLPIKALESPFSEIFQ